MRSRSIPHRHWVQATLIVSAWCACSASTANEAPTPAAAPDNPCSTEKSVVVGGVIGGVFGRILGIPGGSRAGMVLSGTVAGLGCYEYNVRTLQSKTAAQADADYQKSNPAPTPEPVVVSYSAQAEAATAARGQPLKLSSVVELVDGAQQPVREVREELVISNPDGKPFGTASKPFVATTAGRFENTFEIKLPEKAAVGVYRLKTALFVNGAAASTRDLDVQLVWSGQDATLVALK